MTTRTELGTWKARTSGTTLQSGSQVSLAVDDCLIVGLGFQQQNLPTSVVAGNRTMTKAASQINSTSGHGCGIWVARSIATANSRYITATWAASIGARVMVALKLDAGSIRDAYATAVQTASAAPSVGPTGALTEYDDWCIAMLCSEGPSGDTPPTASGWTAGQRDGTVGAPPISNITVAEFYAALDGDDAAQTLSGSGATARDWALCLVALREIVTPPPIDRNGQEIMVGDTVSYSGGSSTVSSISHHRGSPFLRITLANGLVYTAHSLEVV